MEYNKWIKSDKLTVAEKKILKNLSEKEIEDSFYKDLEFGTGGLRGIMGLGTNRMNISTLCAKQRKVLQTKFLTAVRSLPKRAL